MDHASWRQVGYTDRQKCQIAHIEENYENRGVDEHEATRYAWTIVNRQDRGGRTRRTDGGHENGPQAYAKGHGGNQKMEK
ncbi:hypothetical protein GLX_02320 [Komagataeibacter medellinensis NBRC 3288]|uniref:Uncharacterized protein n=1 Tax=Komagataeibacter medellinensis (strain NBRC 3288 / BCRC 11682 / LMG 1693 / Kondo 51) TaxID=634177 RepID=G2I339_KOMMN|nr:hypothetical protein GLX_02320 [Komagataeibacter medellinensis NBRC 3288]